MKPPASPWIWGARVDLAAFGGPLALALVLVALGPALAPSGQVSTPWWLVAVVAVDVAHVWSTLFRTYLDREELAKRPALYALAPVACFAVGAALCALGGELVFWRALAYLAVLHFVRQQVGFVAIYRARSGDRSRASRALDDAVVYAATGYPLLWWHANLPAPFRWFVEGDFVSVPAARALVPAAGAIYAALLVAYAARAGLSAARGEPVPVGKHLVVTSTVVLWYVGIVGVGGARSDFAFTMTNVLAHGVPYLVLLWAYARARAREAPASLVAKITGLGAAAFVVTCVLFALFEEAAWDRLIWHDRPELFGGARDAPLLGPTARALVVPLLALPQATHYVLDAVIWRRGSTGAAQAEALGFGRAAPGPTPASTPGERARSAARG